MIHVFKTTVKNKAQINRLKLKLNKLLSSSEWNFDLEDCDKILRFDSEEDVCQSVIDLLKDHNFECIELI